MIKNGLETYSFIIRVAQNGLIFTSGMCTDWDRSPLIAATVAELEGHMRQWLDGHINEIKEWDHQRKCVPAAAKNGSIK